MPSHPRVCLTTIVRGIASQTVKTKVVVAGDYVCASGWERRQASVARDIALEPSAPLSLGSLASIFNAGVATVEKARLAREGGGGAQPAVLREERAQELRELLAWATSLEAKLAPEVRPVLRTVWERLHPARDTDECPW
jgi:hypothetical protein